MSADINNVVCPHTFINANLNLNFCSPFSGSSVAHELKPGEARLFAWDDPAGDRKLCWSCMVHSAELDLLKVSVVF